LSDGITDTIAPTPLESVLQMSLGFQGKDGFIAENGRGDQLLARLERIIRQKYESLGFKALMGSFPGSPRGGNPGLNDL